MGMSSDDAVGLDLPPDLGDVSAEYRAFLESCALVSRADRRLVRVTGDRAAEMVNGLVTQDIRSLTDRGRPALLLTAKGRVLADMRVFPATGGLEVDVPEAGLENVLATFRKFLPPIYARCEDLGVGYRLIGLYGPRASAAAGIVAQAGLPEEPLGVASLQVGGEAVRVIRDRRLAPDGVELFGPRSALEALWSPLSDAVAQVGGRIAGRRALEIVRVERGVPRYGADMTEDNLAQETGLSEALSFDKGCYLGQEVVARIHFRGHVNRCLRGLRFGDGRPESGAELFSEEKSVGRVTSAVESPELGAIGLGYVRREVEPSSEVEWRTSSAHGSAVIVELPFRRSFEVAETDR